MVMMNGNIMIQHVRRVINLPALAKDENLVGAQQGPLAAPGMNPYNHFGVSSPGSLVAVIEPCQILGLARRREAREWPSLERLAMPGVFRLKLAFIRVTAHRVMVLIPAQEALDSS